MAHKSKLRLGPYFGFNGGGLALGEGVGGSLVQQLFGNGEDGFLFGSWSELDELFTISTGPTAVASDSDPVGLALDDHNWGASTLAQVLAAATELVTNGGFDVDANWTKTANDGLNSVSISGGVGIEVRGSGAAADPSLSQSITGLTANRLYYLAVAANVVAAASGGVSYVDTPLFVAGGSGLGLRTIAAFFMASASSHNFIFRVGGGASASGTVQFDNASWKWVPGNHGLQATSGQRPLWRSNSGKPYLSFDGTDDRLSTPRLPSAAGTLAVAARGGSNSRIAIGVQDASGGRCSISQNSSGFLGAHIGNQNDVFQAGSSSIAGVDFTGVLTWDGTIIELWQNGAKVYSGGQDGTVSTTNALAIGCRNANGTMNAFWDSRIYAALNLSRKATDAEIARITSDFQRTYQ